MGFNIIPPSQSWQFSFKRSLCCFYVSRPQIFSCQGSSKKCKSVRRPPSENVLFQAPTILVKNVYCLHLYLPFLISIQLEHRPRTYCISYYCTYFFFILYCLSIMYGCYCINTKCL